MDHLSATLNDKYPVAKDFRNVYNCIMQALIQGNMKKDVAELERALEVNLIIPSYSINVNSAGVAVKILLS